MKKTFKFILYAVVSFVALSIVVAFLLPSSKKAGDSDASNSVDSPAKQVAAEPPAAQAIPVTAAALQSAYDKNEVSADQAYKNKSLLVSGTIQSIDKDAFDDIVVQLRTGNEFMPAHAYLGNEHENLAASLNKGQKVTWQCTGGGLIIGSPILKDCQPA
jgi:hypothetical protein